MMKKNIYDLISITEARKYSPIAYKAFYDSIKAGFLPYEIKSNNNIDLTDSKELKTHADEIFIPLCYLPQFAIDSYIIDHCEGCYLDVDFASFYLWSKSTGNTNAVDSLFNQIQAVEKISARGSFVFTSDSTELLDRYLKKYKMSHARYNRLKTLFNNNGLQILLDLKYGTARRRTCPRAESFIIEHLLSPDEISQDDIIELLREQAEIEGADACTNCPFKRNTTARIQLIDTLKKKNLDTNLKVCHSSRAGQGMVYPIDRSTISDIKKTISPSTIYYSKNTYSSWDAHYGSKVVRKPCAMINEGWCLDAHEFDLYLYEKDSRALRRPWVTMIIDIASGAIIGSVISYYHNSITTGEAICRAACITAGEEVHHYGLPLYLQCDNGSEMKSKATRRLLHTLGVKQVFARKRSPWSKPIERVFGTIEKRWMRRLPGFCGGRKTNKYKKNVKEKFSRLIAKNAMMDINAFADYWYHRVVPEYNNYRSRRRKQSPNELYKSLPRANTITPSWATMGMLLQEKHSVKVNPEGIIFGRCLYDSLALKEHIGSRVLVCGYESVYTDSVCALHINEKTGMYSFIGEIPLKKVLNYFEEDRLKLANELVLHNLQIYQIKSEIEKIHTVSSAICSEHPMYVHYRTEDHSLSTFYLTEDMDPMPESVPTTHLSEDALKFAIWKNKAELAILEKTLNTVQ